MGRFVCGTKSVACRTFSVTRAGKLLSTKKWFLNEAGVHQVGASDMEGEDDRKATITDERVLAALARNLQL